EYSRQLTEERPLQQQIAEADSESKTEPKPTQPSEFSPDDDDITLLKSLAEKSRLQSNQTPKSVSTDDHYTHDETDSTKSRRLADDYDTTKNGIDNKYQAEPESLHQLDGTPLTAEDIVQKIANKIYEEDDRGVFDRIVSKLLKLGLITESQADTLEVEVAEALQDLITKNAKNNEIQELNNNKNRDEEDRPSRRFDDDDDEETVDDAGDGGDDVVDDDEDGGDEEQEEEVRNADGNWDGASEGNDRNEVNPEEELQDLQYFPNFYRLLKSLDSEQDAEERETLITIMKTLIDFVKMMVKYGTITPEEGVSYLENLDNMIAMQTKNKLGKALGPVSITPPTVTDEDDNTKEETAKMLREYENLKDSTKEERKAVESGHAGKSESYLEAIRKNIEWLKTHNKDENKE
ncbi:secretogranin-3 isoform X1, partial [Clarias magur]